MLIALWRPSAGAALLGSGGADVEVIHRRDRRKVRFPRGTQRIGTQWLRRCQSTEHFANKALLAMCQTWDMDLLT
jgi:hypothetical protein